MIVHVWNIIWQCTIFESWYKKENNVIYWDSSRLQCKTKLLQCLMQIFQGGILQIRWLGFGLFWLPTYPRLIFVKEFLNWLKGKSTYLLSTFRVHDHLPTSSCQHSLWMNPNGDSLYCLTIIWGFHRRLQVIEIQKSRMLCGKLVSEANNLSQIFGNSWQNSDYPGLRVGGKLDFVFISQYVYLKITI